MWTLSALGAAGCWASGGRSRSLTEYPACITRSADSRGNSKKQSDESISEEGKRKPVAGAGMSQCRDLEIQLTCKNNNAENNDSRYTWQKFARCSWNGHS